MKSALSDFILGKKGIYGILYIIILNKKYKADIVHIRNNYLIYVV